MKTGRNSYSYTISVEPVVSQYIEHYQFGAVQALHSQRGLRYGCPIGVAIALLLGIFPLCLWFFHVIPWSAFFMYQETTPAETIMRAHVSGWFILMFYGLFSGLFGLITCFVIWHEESMYDVIYECKNGVLWMNERERTQQMKLALTWNQIEQVRSERHRGRRGRTYYVYYIMHRADGGAIQGREVPFQKLWERCSFELEKRSQATSGN